MPINQKAFKIKNYKTGKIYTGFGRKDFALKHNLDPNLFSALFTGRVRRHKGFCLVSAPFVERKIRLVDLQNNKIVEGNNYREVAKKLNVAENTVADYLTGKGSKRRFKNFVRPFEKRIIRKLINIETGKIYIVTNVSDFCKENNLPPKSIYYLFNDKKVKVWRNWRVVGQPEYFKYRLTDKETGKVCEGVRLNDCLNEMGISYNKLRSKNKYLIERMI